VWMCGVWCVCLIRVCVVCVWDVFVVCVCVCVWCELILLRMLHHFELTAAQFLYQRLKSVVITPIHY